MSGPHRRRDTAAYGSSTTPTSGGMSTIRRSVGRLGVTSRPSRRRRGDHAASTSTACPAVGPILSTAPSRTTHGRPTGTKEAYSMIRKLLSGGVTVTAAAIALSIAPSRSVAARPCSRPQTVTSTWAVSRRTNGSTSAARRAAAPTRRTARCRTASGQTTERTSGQARATAMISCQAALRRSSRGGLLCSPRLGNQRARRPCLHEVAGQPGACSTSFDRRPRARAGRGAAVRPRCWAGSGRVGIRRRRGYRQNGDLGRGRA